MNFSLESVLTIIGMTLAAAGWGWAIFYKVQDINKAFKDHNDKEAERHLEYQRDLTRLDNRHTNTEIVIIEKVNEIAGKVQIQPITLKHVIYNKENGNG